MARNRHWRFPQQENIRKVTSAMEDNAVRNSTVETTQTVRVEPTGWPAYDIHIGPGLLPRAGEIIRPLLARPKTLVVTDENVARHHLDALSASLNAAGIEHAVTVLPAGESTKSWQHLQELVEEILAQQLERNDHIIAFGGGVIGDLAGFAAAIARRGMPFIQIPTTLLAQVDSSVGGKTGINSPHGKNLIGAFHQPSVVLADTDVLATLPRRELLAGYAEVVKYGLLGDADFFAWLEAHGNDVLALKPEAIIHAVATSCRAKAAIVTEDAREKGRRALLNLGHTFGHALEAALGYDGTLLHGEGVAIGMAQALRFSEKLGLCPPGRAARVAEHLAAVGLPVDLRAIHNRLPAPKDLLELMRQDKKASGGKLVFILVRDIGEAFIARDVAEEDVLAFLREELAEA